MTSEVNAIVAPETMLASPHQEDAWGLLYSDIEFFDDVTGETLSHAMTVEARNLEMKFFRRWASTRRSQGMRLERMAEESSSLGGWIVTKATSPTPTSAAALLDAS